MRSLSKSFGILGYVLCLFVFAGCQSTSGKTAGMTSRDASISTAVQEKLTSHRQSNFRHIDVNTERGVVNLNGDVETEAQRAQAARLAQEVTGVVGVNNYLQIQNRPPAGKPFQSQKESVILQEPGIRVIRGEVLRVDGGNYLVKEPNGREVRFHEDTTTVKRDSIYPGDRIEAEVDDSNHARSLRASP